jgi:hypothetical protein
MILIDIRNVCTICAMQKDSFIYKNYCHDCWEAMAK